MINASANRPERIEIARNWLPRYTGMPLDKFGDYILLTNFHYYLQKFAEKFNSKIYGKDKPMQTVTNKEGLTIINFGIGSANVATIMDLLTPVGLKAFFF
jgi:AMP nucleosidase